MSFPAFTTYTYLANASLVSDIAFKSNSVTRMSTSQQYDALNWLSTRLLRLGTLVLLLCCVSCYSLPKQRGTWSGVGGSVVLYDSKRNGYSCAVLEIKDGPTLKKYIPKRVVLVDSKLKTLPPDTYAGKSIRVTGLIVNEHPTCAVTGELLLGSRLNWEGQFGAIYVLQVSKIESY